MKTTQSSQSKRNGFALVITVSLMIILTVLAVGMLSLATISLRSASTVENMAEAKANARLALKIAIGELQKYAGPDRAITATSELYDTATTPVAKPNTTGVWESWWDFNPDASPQYTAEKTNRFKRWLVSSPQDADTKSLNFVTSAWSGRTVELVGNGSLGNGAIDADKVIAGLVPVSQNGKVKGSYAWHVSDESVKARINLYRDPRQNTTLAQKRALLAGHRPDPSVITGRNGETLKKSGNEPLLPFDLTTQNFLDAQANQSAITSLDQAELLDGALDRIKPFRNHITPYSLGLMTDVRGGGLKKDLSSMFEMGSATNNTLPSDFTNRKLYESTHGITGVSDPKWSALAGYYNSFRNLTNAEMSPTIAANATSADYRLGPVIAKVDVVYGLAIRPKTAVFWNITNFNINFVGLMFTPLVTLHNPYNVSISFNRIDVDFANMPVSFQFFKNGLSQSAQPNSNQFQFEPLNTMGIEISGGVYARGNKVFGLKIGNWTNDDQDNFSTTGPIIMKPGQTMICSPSFDPNSTYFLDNSKRKGSLVFDWQNDITGEIKAKPQYTPGFGYEINSVTIGKTNEPPQNNTGFLFLDSAGSTDNFYVQFKVQQPWWYTSNPFPAGKNPPNYSTNVATQSPTDFNVVAKLYTTDGQEIENYAAFKYVYNNNNNLGDFFNNQVYRYPPSGTLTSAAGPPIPVVTKFSEQGPYVHPFAIFSAYARTTSGGVNENYERSSNAGNLYKNGRLAGKPFLFHSLTRSNFTVNMGTDKPDIEAYEVNFQPFVSKGDFEDSLSMDGNRVSAITGYESVTGIKSASYLEIPSGPLQTIADFRRSNSLTTAYLPSFVQPVANSLLHPLMSADSVRENSNVSSDRMLDHSVLANHALYDGFYFSTFATRGTSTPDVVFEQFMNGTAPLASQAFQPYLPVGKTVADVKSELYGSSKPNNNAYNLAAVYQMIRGPFNVNSTSVQAWKAVLATMNKSDITTLWAKSAALQSKVSGGIPIPSMSLLNAGTVASSDWDGAGIDDQRTNDWNGYRALDETHLQTLAEKIVDEVRLRGPFLSMSEFVNRQIGPFGPLTLRGALESAIAKSEINEAQNAPRANSFLNQVPITASDISNDSPYLTPEATTGNPAAGAPGWVNQGDLMRILEPAATVRGDTFVIRTYGEAQDAQGNVTARVYAEAVVQRTPEYVDSKDLPSDSAYTNDAEPANKIFGRKINLVSFRWLSDKEI